SADPHRPRPTGEQVAAFDRWARLVQLSSLREPSILRSSRHDDDACTCTWCNLSCDVTKCENRPNVRNSARFTHRLVVRNISKRMEIMASKESTCVCSLPPASPLSPLKARLCPSPRPCCRSGQAWWGQGGAGVGGQLTRRPVASIIVLDFNAS